MHYMPVRVDFEEEYTTDIFLGVLESTILTSKLSKSLCEDILKSKNLIVKSLLGLMRQINKNMVQTY